MIGQGTLVPLKLSNKRLFEGWDEQHGFALAVTLCCSQLSSSVSLYLRPWVLKWQRGCCSEQPCPSTCLVPVSWVLIEVLCPKCTGMNVHSEIAVCLLPSPVNRCLQRTWMGCIRDASHTLVYHEGKNQVELYWVCAADSRWEEERLWKDGSGKKVLSADLPSCERVGHVLPLGCS